MVTNDHDPKTNPWGGDVVGNRTVLYRFEAGYSDRSVKRVAWKFSDVKSDSSLSSWKRWAKDKQVHHVATDEEMQRGRPGSRGEHSWVVEDKRYNNSHPRGLGCTSRSSSSLGSPFCRSIGGRD